MDNYLASKSQLTNKVLDWVKDIQNMEWQMDRLYKINLYLLRKYKDDLIKEFNIEIPEEVFNDPLFKLLESTFNQKVDTENETLNEILIMSLITSKIEEEMKKEMPDPWYCYGFGGKEN